MHIIELNEMSNLLFEIVFVRHNHVQKTKRPAFLAYDNNDDTKKSIYEYYDWKIWIVLSSRTTISLVVSWS